MPRDSRRTDHAPIPLNGSSGPNIASRIQPSQVTEGSQRNPSLTPLRNGLSRSDSAASSLPVHRPHSIVVPHPAAVFPTQRPRRPSNAASTSSHAPSPSIDMSLPRLASSIYAIYSLARLLIFL